MPDLTGSGDESDAATLTHRVGEGGEVVYAITGDLDLASTEALQAAMDESLGAAGESPAVVLDVSGVRFMDSSGVALLLSVAARAARVEVRNPPLAVRRVIELAGLATTLPMTP